MIENRDLLVQQRLDLLEESGRGRLSARFAREALARALTMALQASPGAPLAGLLLALSGVRVSPAALAGIAVLVPMLVLAARYGQLVAQQRIARPDALAEIDEALPTKGRVGMAEEFLHLGHPTGLHQAALEEALPWLERLHEIALPPALPALTIASVLRARWPFVAAAIILLVIATGWTAVRSDPDRSHYAGTQRQTHTGPDREGSHASPEAPGGRDTQGRSGTAAAPGIAAHETGRDGLRSSTGSAPAASGTMTTRAASGNADRDGARPASATDATGQQANATLANAGRSGAARPAQNDASATQGGTERGLNAGSATAGDENSGDGRNQASAVPRSPSAGTSSLGASGNAARKPGDNRQAAPPQRQGSGQQGAGQQGQQAGRGNGQGQNGPPGGEESGVKRSRGLSGLLLAVPMEDRLTGTSNNGPVHSVTRPAPPRTLPSLPVRAGAPTNGGGNAGSTSQDRRSAQESRLLRDYFKAPGAQESQ